MNAKKVWNCQLYSINFKKNLFPLLWMCPLFTQPACSGDSCSFPACSFMLPHVLVSKDTLSGTPDGYIECFFCSGCFVCTITRLLKSVRITTVQSGDWGCQGRHADIEEPEINGFEAVWSSSEAFLGSQRCTMTALTMHCTMTHLGKGQGMSGVHLDSLQKPEEKMQERSA